VRYSRSNNDGEVKPLLLILAIILGTWFLNNGKSLTTESPMILYGIGLLTVWATVVAHNHMRSLLGSVTCGFLIYAGLMYTTIGVIWH
jgi:hypothetical protein